MVRVRSTLRPGLINWSIMARQVWLCVIWCFATNLQLFRLSRFFAQVRRSSVDSAQHLHGTISRNEGKLISSRTAATSLTQSCFRRKRSISVAANWLITTVSVTRSKTFKPTQPSARTTWNWPRAVRALKKQSALTNCSTPNCMMNSRPCSTPGYSSLSRTCRLFLLRSRCSTTKRQRSTPSWKRSLTNWPRNHNEDLTHWRNWTVSGICGEFLEFSFISFLLATSNNVQTPVKNIEISSPISYPPITNGNTASANGGKQLIKNL